MRVFGQWIVSLAILLVAVVATVSMGGPHIHFVQDVPDDVRRLSLDTWSAFVANFGGLDCLDDVELELVFDVEDGAAAYLDDIFRVQIEIPTTPARYPESLAHELGHHLENTCSIEADLGARLRKAQGLPVDRPWRGAAAWEDSVSEHFAEAVVEIVVGDRPTHADIIPLTPETIDLVAGLGGS